jgi:hypothetical protein
MLSRAVEVESFSSQVPVSSAEGSRRLEEALAWVTLFGRYKRYKRLRKSLGVRSQVHRNRQKHNELIKNRHNPACLHRMTSEGCQQVA